MPSISQTQLIISTPVTHSAYFVGIYACTWPILGIFFVKQ
jgi:hypothetical protein